MESIQFIGTNGKVKNIQMVSIEKLSSKVDGKTFHKETPGFNEERKI